MCACVYVCIYMCVCVCVCVCVCMYVCVYMWVCVGESDTVFKLQSLIVVGLGGGRVWLSCSPPVSNQERELDGGGDGGGGGGGGCERP